MKYIVNIEERVSFLDDFFNVIIYDCLFSFIKILRILICECRILVLMLMLGN